MKREMSFPLKAVGIILCSTLVTTLSASNYNVYFSDPAASMIYGMPDDGVGKPPAMVSGQLAFNAAHIVQLDNNHVVMSPQYHTEHIWEINLLTGKMTEVGVLPEGLKIAAMGTGATPNSFAALAFSGNDETLQIYLGTKSGDSWTLSPQGVSFDTDSQGKFCQLFQLTDQKFVTRHYSLVEIVEPGATPQNTFIQSASEDEYMTLSPANLEMWYIHDISITETVFYDYNGNQASIDDIPQMLQSGYYEWTLWQDLSPTFIGKSGMTLYGEDAPYDVAPTLLYSSLSGDGTSGNPVESKKDISSTTSYFFTSQNTWDCYDTIRHGFYTIVTEPDSLTKRVLIEAGSGPDLGAVVAMDMAPNGIIHALCQQVKGYDIISIDPSTGDRTLIAKGLNEVIYPTISVETDGSYHLFYQKNMDNAGTLECHLELTRLTPGSSTDDYTLSPVTSLLQRYTPQDVILKGGGEGSVLYPMNSEAFVVQSDGASFTSHHGVPAYSTLQSRQIETLPSGEIKLYSVFPPSIWSFDPSVSSLTQLQLNSSETIPSELTWPSDFVLSPNEAAYYISCFNSPNIYAADALTGNISLFANGRPLNLAGDVWGAPTISPPVICCGSSIDLPYWTFNTAKTSSWFLY